MFECWWFWFLVMEYNKFVVFLSVVDESLLNIIGML